ncbi:hypothetical protein FPHOBKDP_00209 [Listeria phage LPJP1]|nr:hypothetical protein FPHOBKDP_00209 [Listeria phage LPJP1]
MTKYLSEKKLDVHLKDIRKWISEYNKFVSANTKNTSPLSINLNSMSRLNYIKEDYLFDYININSGTSTSQFQYINSLIYQYNSGVSISLELIESTMNATIDTLYPNDVPTSFSQDNLWVPHFTYNASEPFNSEKLILNESAEFVNGIAIFSTDSNFKKLFSVRDFGSKLSDENNPASNIIGISYDIEEYYIRKDNTVRIVLEDKDVNSTLLLVYTQLDNDNFIKSNQKYDPTNYWHTLDPNKNICSIESLLLSYECYSNLYDILPNSKWMRARDITKDTIKFILDMPIKPRWITSEINNLDPLSDSGSFINKDSSDSVLIYRDDTNGNVILNSISINQDIHFGVNKLFTLKDISYIESRIKTDNDKVLKFIIEDKDHNIGFYKTNVKDNEFNKY